MEIIKKVIERAVTTGATTGCTPCAVIIPDLDVIYNFKILLTGTAEDIGFFDVAFQSDYYTYIEVNENYYAYLRGEIPYDELDFVTVGTPPEGNEVRTSEPGGEGGGGLIPLYPTVTTGVAPATPITALFFQITNNVVNNNGGTPILEYGILWSTSKRRTDTLVYDGTDVTRLSTSGDIAMSTPYNSKKVLPTAGSTVYFRAFARNSQGAGYGTVKSVYYQGPSTTTRTAPTTTSTSTSRTRDVLPSQL